MTHTEIGSMQELRDLLGGPAGRAVTKERTRLHARSQLWEPESWRPDALPSHATLVKTVQDTPETLEELEEHYAPAHYSRLLY
jgi:hypothetical protein